VTVNSLICPFFCDATVVSFKGPNWNPALTPNSAALGGMNAELVGNETLPASTNCTISS
jgi:hypothetical protein